MKPRIFKRDGQWLLRFPYHPRSFNLFGATGDERAAIIARSFQDLKLENWSEGFVILRQLYRRGEVRRR